MSGGPTFDSSGKVVGVNVARAGAELSLFVPSQFLASLLARAQARGLTEPESFSTDIARQLVEHLRPARAALARDSHQMQRLGRFQAPTVLDDTIRCWDRSRRSKEDDLYRVFHSSCATEHGIYLSSEIQVGRVEYSFAWLESDELGRLRFTRLYEQYFHRRTLGHTEKRDHTPMGV